MTKQRRIQWNLVWTALLLITSYWVTDAYVDARSSSSKTFLGELLHPDLGELLFNLLVYAMLLWLIWKQWSQANVSYHLADSLEQTLEVLALEKARSESMLAALPDAVSVQDRELRIVYQNPAHIEQMGDHPGEYCYAAYRHLSSPCEGCHILSSLADGLPHRREASSQVGDEIRHVEIFSAPVKDHMGQIIAGIESVRDISARKSAELRLRQQLGAFEASMDGMAILNPAGEYIYLNKAHAIIYGYPSPDELIGKSWKVLYTDEERERLEPVIYAGFAAEGRWRGEATGLKKDGTLYPQEVSLTVTDDGGIICVVRDISDRRRAEAEIGALNADLRQKTLDLQVTNNELKAFSYSLSHDLRTPLAGIYMASRAVIDMCGGQLDELGTSMLDAICQHCERMEELIESMLVLFRVTSTDLTCENVDLSSMADEIMAGLRLRDVERPVEWSLEKGMTVQADPQLVHILLQNLIGNAWKYSAKKEQTRIEFGKCMKDGITEYFVRDNGAGFPMGAAKDIFKPFKRLHSSADFPGSGIGLATVHRIVERHGGRTWAEGEVGVGATFHFSFPPAENVAEGAHPAF